MSGFDNGTQQGGVFFQAKQFGAITRGFGPPVPQSGVIGDLYIDMQTWQLFTKRAANNIDPWGNYLFVVPVANQVRLKWFSPARPADSLGTDGDYCLLWGGYGNYGMQFTAYGPKAAGAWPANASATVVAINPLYGAQDIHGL